MIYHEGKIIRYALKFISNEKWYDAKREADNICRIPKDERLVRYFGWFQFRNWIIIGMELCDGTLNHYLNHPSFTGQNPQYQRFARWDILRKIVGALHECHSQRFMHRDIKPDNSTLIIYGANVPSSIRT